MTKDKTLIVCCEHYENALCKSPYYKCPKEICCKLCSELVCASECQQEEMN